MRRTQPEYEEERAEAPQGYVVDGEFDPEDEYSDYDEELDNEHRFHIAMNVFNMISVLAGLVVILVLVGMLVSLVSWLRGDIAHSFTLLQSTLQ